MNEMRFIGEIQEELCAQNVPPPCRTIVVTPEMRARDAEERRMREARVGSDWKIKASLGVSQPAPMRPVGMRSTRLTTVAARRAAPRVERVRKPNPICARCLAEMYRQTKSAYCRRCRPTMEMSKPKPVRFCASCNCGLDRRTKRDVCRSCVRAKGRTAYVRKPRLVRVKRTCAAAECERVLSPLCKGDLCTRHCAKPKTIGRVRSENEKQLDKFWNGLSEDGKNSVFRASLVGAG